MIATITIADTPSGNANVDLKFSEPTPELAKATPATLIALELLEHIKRRTTGGTEQTTRNGKTTTVKRINRNHNRN
jgi:hypothetical protein